MGQLIPSIFNELPSILMRLCSEETERHWQPQTATGNTEGQRMPGAWLSSASLLTPGLATFFGVGVCPPGFLINAAALENGVEHRGRELAGRSVGAMVGDRRGLGEGGGLSCGHAGGQGAAPHPWTHHPSPRVMATRQKHTWHPVEPKVFLAVQGAAWLSGAEAAKASPCTSICRRGWCWTLAQSPHPWECRQGWLPPSQSGAGCHSPQLLLQRQEAPASP